MAKVRNERRGRAVAAILVGVASVVGLAMYGQQKPPPAPMPAPAAKPDAAAALAALAEAGSALHRSKGCNVCHSTDGSRMMGPTLAGVIGSEVTLADGRTVVADEAYFRRSVFEPAAELTAGYANMMQSFQGTVTEGEVRALMAYYQSLPKPQTAAEPQGEGAAEGHGEGGVEGGSEGGSEGGGGG